MTKKTVQLALVLALFVVLCLSILPVLADQGNQDSSNNPTPTPTPNPGLQDLQQVPFISSDQTFSMNQAGVLPEVVERRTATSKHYQVGPNLYRADISSVPIHYQDTNGNWQDIDTRPVAQPEGGFTVEASDVKMVFPEALAQSGLRVNATIYPDQPEQQRASVSKPVKPDLATLFKDNPTVGKTAQGSPVQLSLQWQPQNLAYTNDLSPATNFYQFTGMTARAVEDGVEYFQDLDNITLTFEPSAIGLVQRLNFAVPPTAMGVAPNKGATKLEYRIDVKLPNETRLYSHGVEQTNNFITDLLELRDKIGNRLLILPAPQLRDQTASRTLPQTQYRIERLPDGIALIAELPLDWLNNPNRKYPVMAEFSAIFPLALINQPMPFNQDTWIYECLPNGGVNTVVMWIGRFLDVGCSNTGIERSLVQWTVNSLPPNAVIVDPTDSQLWRLPINDTGGGTQIIGTHRLLVPWDSSSATWLSRVNGTPWTQPGAENDYLTSLETTVGVPSGGANGYINMGSLDSLVGAWHTDQYFFPWGDPNYGVLYKSTSETIPNLDRAFAQSELSTSNSPLLSVTYADPPLSAFITPLAPNTNYFTPRAPSPDYYQINNASGWRAFGVRPLDGRSDYDLFISASQNFTSSIVANSLEFGSVPDFVVINPNVSATLYPWAIQWEGTGLYYLRYPTQSGVLDLGGTTLINSTAFTFTVLSIYQVNMTAGQQYQINLNVSSGDADLGLALFAPTNAGGSNFMTRDAALILSDNPSFGGPEEIVYVPTVSGQYGLAVWNNGGTQPSNYALSLGVAASPDLRVLLPLIVKDYVPPLSPLINGNFETGAFSPWTNGGPGGYMVASLVPNPSPGCFLGNVTAQLGTPGQFANNTIPIGEVEIEQQFHIPAGSSQLIFKYRVFSYDVIQGSSGRPYDKFEVKINGNSVLISGNPASSSNGQTLWESGCQTGSINVSAYAGQNVALRFSVFNLTFPSFNTWAFVDDVQIQ